MDLYTRVLELDRLTSSGRFMEALEKFYHPDVTTREGNQVPVISREAHQVKLISFFSNIERVNRITLHRVAVGNDVTMSEYTFDLQNKEGHRILWNEVLRRRWKNGLVIDERYYTAS
ncbi:MAG: nuclear transport factor 2 family protein [Balneolaceae bacterium]|nr:nuclear transport factor 2 family protein [Balneolaceae bacterium]